MPQNLKSSMVLRLSVFFRLLISHLVNFCFEFPKLPGAHTPESISQLCDCKYVTYIASPFCSDRPQLLAPHLSLHRHRLPAITCEALTTPWSLSDTSSVIRHTQPKSGMRIFLHAVGDGAKGHLTLEGCIEMAWMMD